MKTGKKILLSILVIVVVAISISAARYFSPKTFLKGIEPSNVSSIAVFDGNTGNGFVIEDEAEIQYIVENIQSFAMTREKVSVGYDGYSFRMNFYDNSGKEIDNFIINSTTTIRDDPFFYRCNGDLCFDYLKELEDTYSML
jgi:opacity protein-like surface antigen